MESLFPLHLLVILLFCLLPIVWLSSVYKQLSWYMVTLHMDWLPQWLALYVFVYYDLFSSLIEFLSCCSNCVLMSSSISVFLFLNNWSFKHCSAVTGVAFTCSLFLVISCLVFITHTVYDQLLWLWSSLSMMVPLVHGLLSLYLATTFYPIQIEL